MLLIWLYKIIDYLCGIINLNYEIMFRLHYKGVNSTNESVKMFETHPQMIDFIDEKCIGRNGTVTWMTGREDSTDVFMSNSHVSIQNYLERKSCCQTRGDYFLYEYENLDEAIGASQLRKRAGIKHKPPPPPPSRTLKVERDYIVPITIYAIIVTAILMCVVFSIYLT